MIFTFSHFKMVLIEKHYNSHLYYFLKLKEYMKKTIMLFLAVSALENVEAQKNGRELIINGNFANNDCSEDWCIFNTPISVRGWTPKPEI